MMTISGYQQITYKDLQKLLETASRNTEKTVVKIAAEINVNSSTTVSNAFNKIEQKVSDEVLSSVMKCVSINGFIVWENGKRLYFVSKNGK